MSMSDDTNTDKHNDDSAKEEDTTVEADNKEEEEEEEETEGSDDESQTGDWYDGINKLRNLINSSQSIEKSTTELSFVIEKIHVKLTELQQDIEVNDAKLSAEMGQQLWDRLFQLWLELSKETAQITTIDLPSVAQCFLMILSIRDTLKGVARKNNRENVQTKQFLICLSILDLPHINAYLGQTSDISDEIINSFNVRFVMRSIRWHPYVPLDILQKLSEKIDLLVVLKNYVNERIESTTLETESTVDYILLFFWNLCNQTFLVPIMIEIGLPEYVVRWLLQRNVSNNNSEEIRSFISIIHNLARHDDGADELNKYGAVEAIKRFRSRDWAKIDKEDLLVASMALALLSTPEQLKSDKKGMNSVLDQLLQITLKAASDNRFEYWGFHVSEPLAVMVKLFVVEERTVDYIMCHAETDPTIDITSTIHLFTKLLIDFQHALVVNKQLEQFTLIAVLNILWSISFQSQYGFYLSNDNEEAMSLIASLAETDQKVILDQYKPRSMEGVREAARGILHNLATRTNNPNGQEEDASNRNETEQNDSNAILMRFAPCFLSNIQPTEKPSIMISYSHDNKDFCNKVLELFKGHCDVFDVWVDQTHCQSAGDLWESIANGMEHAQIIVCLVSDPYYESKSCRQEFIYATDILKKSIVPVLLENFKPKGWLGIRMPGVKYVRCKNVVNPDQEKMTDLLNTILLSLEASQTATENIFASRRFSINLQREKPNVQSRKNSIALETACLPLNEWTSASINDIKQWFASNHISTELRDLYDFRTGEEMIDYARTFPQNYDKHFEIYSRAFKKRFNGEELLPHQFKQLARAMEKLIEENKLPSISNPLEISTESEQQPVNTEYYSRLNSRYNTRYSYTYLQYHHPYSFTYTRIQY